MIMKRLTLLLSLLSIMTLSLMAKPTITVQAVVYGKDTKEPLVGAMVRDLKTNYTTTTDVDGRFIMNVETDSKIEISYLGYKNRTVKAKQPDLIINMTPDRSFGVTRFISITGGPLLFADTFRHHADFGFMGGRIWSKWGFYVKGDLPMSFKSSEQGSKMGAAITFGAIKTLTEKWNVFAGVGFGLCLNGFWEEEYGYDSSLGYYVPTDRYFEYCDVEESLGVPFELGFLWTHKHLNLLFGFQWMMNTSDAEHFSRQNLKPYVGVGYTF